MKFEDKAKKPFGIYNTAISQKNSNMNTYVNNTKYLANGNDIKREKSVIKAVKYARCD